MQADVREPDKVHNATQGIETLFHLAAVNGTQNFYDHPDRVLDVGVKGLTNTIDAAIAEGVNQYIFASSSEVYHHPEQVPTDEEERMIIPDINNPRFSYSATKIIGEAMTLHQLGREEIETKIIRPHNIYGARMGYKHVMPEFILRMEAARRSSQKAPYDFQLKGTGEETRAFCHIDDAVRGIHTVYESGNDSNIYNVGVTNEITIRTLAQEMSRLMGIPVNIQSGPAPEGSTARRCPDISKLSNLGYEPEVGLEDGLSSIIDWYLEKTPQSKFKQYTDEFN